MFTTIRPVLAVAAIAAAAIACQQRPLPTVREGRTLYAKDGCASCPGAEGHGDGAVAPTLDPRPHDFRDVAAFERGFEVEAIARTLATGIPAEAPPHAA